MSVAAAIVGAPGTGEDILATAVWTEHAFPSWDGTELFYRARRPPGAKRQALLLFHRGHEHSGRLTELADALALDANVYAWDQRGHGRSPGPRGYADDFSVIVRDADAFARHIRR